MSFPSHDHRVRRAWALASLCGTNPGEAEKEPHLFSRQPQERTYPMSKPRQAESEPPLPPQLGGPLQQLGGTCFEVRAIVLVLQETGLGRSLHWFPNWFEPRKTVPKDMASPGTRVSCKSSSARLAGQSCWAAGVLMAFTYIAIKSFVLRPKWPWHALLQGRLGPVCFLRAADGVGSLSVLVT